MDYGTLNELRQRHPAWRLLRAEHAPLIASFLYRVFIAPNVRGMAQADLAEASVRERIKPFAEFIKEELKGTA